MLAHARAMPCLRIVELGFTLRGHCGIVVLHESQYREFFAA
jgi:hypothetical protein